MQVHSSINGKMPPRMHPVRDVHEICVHWETCTPRSMKTEGMESLATCYEEMMGEKMRVEFWGGGCDEMETANDNVYPYTKKVFGSSRAVKHLGLKSSQSTEETNGCFHFPIFTLLQLPCILSLY